MHEGADAGDKAVEAYSEGRDAQQPRAGSKAATREGQTPTTGAGRGVAELGNAAAGVAGGAGRVLDGVADLAAKAIETLADFLGGGDSSPSPEPTAEQSAMADPKPATPGTPEEATQREEAQRSTHRQELLRDYGREIPAEIERDAAIERDRGRERER